MAAPILSRIALEHKRFPFLLLAKNQREQTHLWLK